MQRTTPESPLPIGAEAGCGRTDPADRRWRPTPFWSRHVWFGGRRRQVGRRSTDRRHGFVDQHGQGLFLIVTAVALLNFLDAWFTIFYLSHGGQELNPIVDSLLRQGLWPFVLVKCLGIGLCCVVLTLTKTFGVARAGLAIVAGGYVMLLGWHLSLLDHVPA